MRSVIKLVFLVVVCFSSNNSFAQQYKADDDNPSIKSKNLVLEVAVNSKNYDIITHKLRNTNGLTLFAYCEDSKLFLINYNPQIIPKPQAIVDSIEQLDPNYKTKIIHNIKFEDVIKDCKLFMLPILMEVE